MSYLKIEKKFNESTTVESKTEQETQEQPRVKHKRVIAEPVAGNVQFSVGNISGVSKKTSPEQMEKMFTKRNELLQSMSSEITITAPVGGNITESFLCFDFAADSDSDEEKAGSTLSMK
ncbi:hypothetical protein [Legionella sp. 16cNR16C]|uniref:hypothetical protein n=1 Tax=Legionella sp. 16cNR16C TaxID=2905656 RepID=UPI001E3D98CD|nr:hypothetical protein [Legionella sp. 16cNR16C]MCE3046457.1 hypothetical protein [Legionella sp. 16cNR16C]